MNCGTKDGRKDGLCKQSAQCVEADCQEECAAKVFHANFNGLILGSEIAAVTDQLGAITRPAGLFLTNLL